jgi:HD-like signal output (HDOD) protein
MILPASAMHHGGVRSRPIVPSLIIALVGVGVIAIAWRVLRSRPQAEAPDPGPASSEPAPATATEAASYSTDAIDGVFDELYRIAFGVPRFDYQILGDHAAVLERVDASIADSVNQRNYFPRRPRLLPRLLQTLNDDSSRDKLVELIVEDPALAGSVLKLANSAFYRLSPEPVESLDRAVVILGADGLRNLVATAIMQPVFRLPKGFFDNFATLTWEQAQRTAAAAEATAKSERGSDPFVAQVLGLLTALARLVIFRLTLDRYREHPNILPRAEVFIRAMQQHGPQMARLIAESWEMSQSSLSALDEQAQRATPEAMSPLGRAVYFGELAGALALLFRRNVHSVDGAHVMLRQQGLSDRALESVWRAASMEGTRD